MSVAVVVDERRVDGHHERRPTVVVDVVLMGFATGRCRTRRPCQSLRPPGRHSSRTGSCRRVPQVVTPSPSVSIFGRADIATAASSCRRRLVGWRERQVTVFDAVAVVVRPSRAMVSIGPPGTLGRTRIRIDEPRLAGRHVDASVNARQYSSRPGRSVCAARSAERRDRVVGALPQVCTHTRPEGRRHRTRSWPAPVAGELGPDPASLQWCRGGPERKVVIGVSTASSLAAGRSERHQPRRAVDVSRTSGVAHGSPCCATVAPTVMRSPCQSYLGRSAASFVSSCPRPHAVERGRPCPWAG